MARKTVLVTIDAAGRDKGKTFLIREMPAVQAEKWATKALLVFSRSGVDIPEEALSSGMAGLASINQRLGALALIAFKMIGGATFDGLEPLLDEMMGCVSVRPDPGNPAFTRPLMFTPNGEGDDIEEVSTILRLRSEVLGLHLNFSLSAAFSKLTAAMSPTASPNTETSLAP